MIQLKHIAH